MSHPHGSTEYKKKNIVHYITTFKKISMTIVHFQVTVENNAATVANHQVSEKNPKQVFAISCRKKKKPTKQTFHIILQRETMQ